MNKNETDIKNDLNTDGDISFREEVTPNDEPIVEDLVVEENDNDLVTLEFPEQEEKTETMKKIVVPQSLNIDDEESVVNEDTDKSAIKILKKHGKNIKIIKPDEKSVGMPINDKLTTGEIIKKYVNPVHNGDAYLGFVSYFTTAFILTFVGKGEYLMAIILGFVAVITGFCKHGFKRGGIVGALVGSSKSILNTNNK